MRSDAEARGAAGAGPLVVAAAMGIEARALRRGLSSARVVCTGIGPDRARRAVAALRREGCGALAIAGVAGSLDPTLSPGDLVVASSLTALGGGGVLELASAPDLVRCLERLGHRAVAAPLLSSDHLVRGRERQQLRDRGARIVDMESAWLAEAAEGRPLAVLRVIVDAPASRFASLSLLRNGVRALRVLRDTAGALEAWAAGATERDPARGGEPRRSPGAHPHHPRLSSGG